ncbi:MAG: thioesterase domain-containing protein, partial [Aurantibacter sp.]
VVYGAAVSGRSGDFPNLDLMAGMFMNVQPVRIVIKDDQSFSGWFKSIQEQQQAARKYEYTSQDQIASFINWPAARPLFDSLLIFENYPAMESKTGDVEVSDFRSGLTSTYPVTMAVVPGENKEFILSILPEIVPEKSAIWLLESFEQILTCLISDKADSNAALDSFVQVFQDRPNLEKKPTKTSLNRSYVAPRNEFELQLVRIWENLFGLNSIGIRDNFFDLGGKSLLAVKMFSVINAKFQTKLPPTTLLEHPSIAAITKLLRNNGNSVAPTLRNVVPLRANGEKTPLFCIHAGGGHVFFYSSFANHISADRPVYALQPSGILGKDERHQGIEEMARDYIKEIRMVQPEGPYNFMVYCFSTAVGLEMSILLKTMGEKSNLIVMDTMAEQEQKFTKARITMRVFGFLKRLVKNPLKTVNIMVYDRWVRYIAPIWTQLVGNAEEKAASKMGSHLVRLYNEYQWRPVQVGITLILTPKADKRFNMETYRSWKEITSGQIEVLYTVGNHRTIFEEPDVKFAAKTIEGFLEHKNGAIS